MHGLPLTYNKDMQEDKEPLFDSCDTLELCLDAADRDARDDQLPTASAWPLPRPTSSWPRPTSPTCSSAAGCRSGRPTASSPGSCARPLEQGKLLSELTPSRAGGAVPAARRRVLPRCSQDGAWLETKVSEGGTSLARVREQLRASRAAALR